MHVRLRCAQQAVHPGAGRASAEAGTCHQQPPQVGRAEGGQVGEGGLKQAGHKRLARTERSAVMGGCGVWGWEGDSTVRFGQKVQQEQCAGECGEDLKAGCP